MSTCSSQPARPHIACIDGRFDVIGGTADPNETVGQVADRAYGGKPYRSVSIDDEAGTDVAEPPICVVHRSPMVWVERNGAFWSCHKENPERIVVWTAVEKALAHLGLRAKRAASEIAERFRDNRDAFVWSVGDDLERDVACSTAARHPWRAG